MSKEAEGIVKGGWWEWFECSIMEVYYSGAIFN